jgi:Protein of unknown function (DUF3551)
MRIFSFALAVFVAVFTIGAPAQAQNYPWCAEYTGGMGGTNCGFTTFQQCQATVSGIGGFCTQNPMYQPPAGSRPSSRTR